MEIIDPKIQQMLEEAIAMHHLGRVAEAETAYREILKSEPDNAVVHNNLGIAILAQKRTDEAIKHLKRALEISPEYLEAHNNLGNALRESGDHELACMAFEHALEVNPQFVQALGNLGNTLLDLGKLDEALETYDKAIALMEEIPELHYNQGRILYELGRWEDAEDAFRQTLKLNPSYPLAHWNLSHVLLLQGRFSEGWPEFEWRWQCPGFTTQIPDFGVPRWNGASLKDRTILLYGEQGFGDTIQFVRYAPVLAAGGAKIVLLCQSELARLAESVEGVETVTTEPTDLPHFDVHSPLMSLPLLVGSEVDTVPADVPYVSAPVEGTDLAAAEDGYKVGLAWSGRSTHALEQQRSLDADALAPLLDIPGCTFFALHDDPEAAGLAGSALAGHITDLSDSLTDFADTARIIDQLDLVICVDTAVGHLAGALGKPVWVLLPKICDWRWMIDREDSPWYPSMRLFRQQDPGEWDPVVENVRTALTQAAGA